MQIETNHKPVSYWHPANRVWPSNDKRFYCTVDKTLQNVCMFKPQWLCIRRNLVLGWKQFVLFCVRVNDSLGFERRNFILFYFSLDELTHSGQTLKKNWVQWNMLAQMFMSKSVYYSMTVHSSPKRWEFYFHMSSLLRSTWSGSSQNKNKGTNSLVWGSRPCTRAKSLIERKENWFALKIMAANLHFHISLYFYLTV